METAELFIKGIVLGFSIAAPVGPIGVLCIRRTLNNGMANGLACGAGAATADAIYGFIAAIGVTAVAAFLADNGHWLRLCGGLFLLYLGIATFKAKPAAVPATTARKGLPAAFSSTFALTLTNPMTILSFAAIFAGLGAGSTGGSWNAAGIMVLGVFSGSLLWWILLSGAVALLRGGFNARRMIWVNRVSGMVICIFGLLSLGSLLK